MGGVALEIFEDPPNIGYYSVYNHSNSLPDTLYSLKSFKCMHAVTGKETNDLSASRMTKNGMKKLPTKRPTP